MSFVIRGMLKKDIKQVQDVVKKSWNSTYEGIIPLQVQENFLNNAYNDEMMKKRLKGSLIFVAEIEDKAVGFANFTPINSERQSELSAIYLYQNYKGKGVGTALLHKGIKDLGNLKEIYIDVEKENTIGKIFTKQKDLRQLGNMMIISMVIS